MTDEEIKQKIEDTARKLKSRLYYLDLDDENSSFTHAIKDKLHDDCLNYLIAYYLQENRRDSALYEFLKKDVEKLEKQMNEE